MTVELKVEIVDESCCSYLFVDGEKIASFGRSESKWSILSHCAYCVGRWLVLPRPFMSKIEQDRRLYVIMEQLLKQLDRCAF